MSKDAIVILREDHKRYAHCSASSRTSAPPRTPRGKIVRKAIELPDGAHLHRERGHVPRGAPASTGPRGRRAGVVEEHHVADLLVMELSTMKPNDERFRGEDHGADRERPPPHGRGGVGLVSQGPKRLEPDHAAGARRPAPRGQAAGARSPAQPSALKKAVDAVVSLRPASGDRHRAAATTAGRAGPQPSPTLGRSARSTSDPAQQSGVCTNEAATSRGTAARPHARHGGGRGPARGEAASEPVWIPCPVLDVGVLSSPRRPGYYLPIPSVSPWNWR